MTTSLVGEALPRSKLSDRAVKTMFNLFYDYYDATFENFLRDLNNKNWVILLRDTSSGTIQGFSSVAFYKSIVQSEEVGVVYSGDTIIRPAYWGTQELPRTWIKTVLKVGENLPKPLYWLLISSGYKTYRYLAFFFKEYYPRYDCQTPADTKAIIDHLASERFGSEYNSQSGIVCFTTSSTPLRAGVAEVTERLLEDPHIAFFIKKNPGYTKGDELVCLTTIHIKNLTPFGKQML